MIGVDTNVLARLFVNDDASQHQAAVKFFSQRSKDDPAFVSLVVVVELVWLLSTKYQYSTESVRLALSSLLDSPDFHVQDRDLVAAAVAQSAEPRVDLVDVLICGLGLQQGCSTTATFDRDAAKRISGMELLA